MNFSRLGEYISDITDEERDDDDEFSLFYSEKCPWSEEMKDAFTDEEFVQSVIVPQIMEKGIGSDAELMNKMAKTQCYSVAYEGNAEGILNFEPLFWDSEWYETYGGYDNVAMLLYCREDMDQKEFFEEVESLSEDELAELIQIRKEYLKDNGIRFKDEPDVIEVSRLEDKLDIKRGKVRDEGNAQSIITAELKELQERNDRAFKELLQKLDYNELGAEEFFDALAKLQAKYAELKAEATRITEEEQLFEQRDEDTQTIDE